MPSLTHAHTHTSKHTSKHTHGPHILCMVTACSLLFGCQYCNTALWLNSWPVSVCLQSVCQPCYDVICSSERQTEKLMTLVKSGKIFPAASPLSLSSVRTTTFFLLIHTHHIIHLFATHSLMKIYSVSSHCWHRRLAVMQLPQWQAPKVF